MAVPITNELLYIFRTQGAQAFAAEMKKMGASQKEASQAAADLTKAQSSSNFALLSFTQVAQDAGQFSNGLAQGVRAVTNNVQQTAQAFVIMRTRMNETGLTMGTFLKDLIKGPGGWLLAFSLVTVGIEAFTNWLERSKKGVSDLADEIEEDGIPSLEKLAEALDAVFDVDSGIFKFDVPIKEANLALKESKETLGGLTEIAEEYKGELRDLNLLAQETVRAGGEVIQRGLTPEEQERARKLREDIGVLEGRITEEQALQEKLTKDIAEGAREVAAEEAARKNTVLDTLRDLQEQEKLTKEQEKELKRLEAAEKRRVKALLAALLAKSKEIQLTKEQIKLMEGFGRGPDQIGTERLTPAAGIFVRQRTDGVLGGIVPREEVLEEQREAVSGHLRTLSTEVVSAWREVGEAVEKENRNMGNSVQAWASKNMETVQAWGALTANTFGALADAADAFFSMSGERATGWFKLMKGFAIAEALANTYVGATKALAQGGVLGWVGAGVVIAQGLALVAQIAALQPSSSGSTGGIGVAAAPRAAVTGTSFATGGGAQGFAGTPGIDTREVGRIIGQGVREMLEGARVQTADGRSLEIVLENHARFRSSQ